MARITGPRKVYRYTNDFKLKAVKLTEIGGIQVKQVAAALEIHPWMLTRWRKHKREGLIVTKGVQVEKDIAAELKELRRVKKEYERLKLEHEILKKAIAFTSARKGTSLPSSSTARKPTR
ncbi:MAG: transposase [Nevskia sp.]|nr:transposase [Nevskia sp.]